MSLVVLHYLPQVVPPGYYAPATGDIQQCPDGRYRVGWAVETGAQSCGECGTGISSDGVEAVARKTQGQADTVALVRGSEDACSE